MRHKQSIKSTSPCNFFRLISVFSQELKSTFLVPTHIIGVWHSRLKLRLISNLNFLFNFHRDEKIDSEDQPRSAYFLGANRPKNVSSHPVWMKIVHLPWMTLTLNDRQVLQQTHSSLCSRNASIVSGLG